MKKSRFLAAFALAALASRADEAVGVIERDVSHTKA